MNTPKFNAKLATAYLPPTPAPGKGLVKSLENRMCRGYICRCGIDLQRTTLMCRDSTTPQSGKLFFAPAFQNDLGNYEFRNKYDKGMHNNKAITIICRYIASSMLAEWECPRAS